MLTIDKKMKLFVSDKLADICAVLRTMNYVMHMLLQIYYSSGLHSEIFTVSMFFTLSVVPQRGNPIFSFLKDDEKDITTLYFTLVHVAGSCGGMTWFSS